MRDGKIVDDHPVESPVKEDLRDLAHSRLGEMLLTGDDTALLAQAGLTAPGDVSALGLLRQMVAGARRPNADRGDGG
jgi:hypothetical protein